MARAYQYITSKTSPNQNARNSKITGLTIHWWGTPSGQSPEGVVSWLCDKRAGTSAHYVVSEGTVWCLVDPDRRAWHAGNSKANHTQIGIELDPNQSRRAATEKTSAALIADLRAVYGNLPLYPHRRWTSTQCPGNWDLGRLDRLARGVKPGIPIGGGASVPAPKPAAKPSTGKLAVDGKLGPATARRIQSWLKVTQDGVIGPDTIKAWQRGHGTPVDGRITGQGTAARPACPAIRRDCLIEGSGGSRLIRAVQAATGLTGKNVDGKLGPDTVRALQRHYNRVG